MNQPVIELDDGKIYRNPLYLMVKTMVSGSDFPLNQSIEPAIGDSATSTVQTTGA